MDRLLQFWKNDLYHEMMEYVRLSKETKDNIELKQNYIGHAEAIQKLLKSEGHDYDLHF